MKAALLEQSPGDLVVADVQVRGPSSREILIRTAAAGLCHSDLHFMDGSYPCAVPSVLGHESAGVVEAVGPDVTYVKPGEHVVTCISGFCGQCEFCLRGRPNLCDRIGIDPDPSEPPRLSRDGAAVHQFFGLSSFAEQLLVHENFVVKIRDDFPLQTAALLGCGVTTGIGAVVNTAKVQPGDTVAVLGCGGIGLNAIQAAALVGASRVIAVDRLASKLDLARTFGATDVVDASSVDAVGAVMEITGGGVDHSFEAIGRATTVEQAFGMLRKGGTATVIGMVPLGEKVSVEGIHFLAEKRLQGSTMGSNRFRIDMPKYIDWYLAGRLKLDELVSGVMPIEQINDGFDRLKQGDVARQLVVFD